MTTKAILNVPIALASEEAVASAVIQSTPNDRILIIPRNEDDELSEMVGPFGWFMKSISAIAVASLVVTRELTVQKVGTRFRVFDQEEVNLAQESELPYLSFRSFGEFVQLAMDGTFDTGGTAGTPGTPAVPAVVGDLGNISAVVNFVNGSVIEAPFTVFSDGTTSTEPLSNPTLAQVTAALGEFGNVTPSSQDGDFTGAVTFEIDLDSNSPSISMTIDGSLSATWNRNGYVAPVAAIPAVPAVPGSEGNAILLDQISGRCAFVYLDEIPAGTDLAIVERPSATENGFFE